jgi:hypothetical protein
VEHVRVYPAYPGTLPVYPAPPAFEEVTVAVMMGTDGVAGYVKCPVLIAQFVIGCRDQCCPVQAAQTLCVIVQQERVIVKVPRTALSAEVALEAHFLYDPDESYRGIFRKAMKLLV